MTLESALPALEAAALHRGRGFSTTPVVQVIACDLMSDVLVQDGDDPLLVTSLATLQAVRTADIVGAVGIVLVNGKSPSEAMLRLAREMDISLVGSPLSMFRACVALGREVGPR